MSPARLERQLAFLFEVDAGDTFVFDQAGPKTKPDCEHAAAVRALGLSPEGQGGRLGALWEE